MRREDKTWTFAHAVECSVTVDFAWTFWTNVSNWVLDADIESVHIDGPFGPGARGVTNSKASGQVEWRITDVQAGRAVIEFPLTGAVGRFTWTFEKTDNGTRITQHCTLEGDQAEAYAKAVGPNLEAGIPAGMQKLCDTMTKAAKTN